MWKNALLIIASLWALAAAVPSPSASPHPLPTPLWSPEQVGDYFNGIFRSVVGPILGFDIGAGNSTNTN